MKKGLVISVQSSLDWSSHSLWITQELVWYTLHTTATQFESRSFLNILFGVFFFQKGIEPLSQTPIP